MLNGHEIERLSPAPEMEAGRLSCARVYDSEQIMQFYGQREIWSIMRTDDSPDAEDVDFEGLARSGDSMIFILVSVSDEPAGLFMFASENSSCCSIHSAVLPEFWGSGLAHVFGLKACSWIFENTRYHKIITLVPKFNDGAMRMAQSAGMLPEGCIRKSFMKGGVLHDQVMYGFTREDYQCPWQQLQEK